MLLQKARPTDPGKICPRATEEDIYAAVRLRELRRERGMSLGSVAKKVSRSGAQLQKYEACENRMSVGVIVKLAKILDVSPEVFLMPRSDDRAGIL